jgi:serine protease Do
MDDSRNQNGGRQSYYYSYGPYNPRHERNRADDLPEVEVVASNTVPVEVSLPRSGRVRKSLFARPFVMFMVGALVVSSLMFAADKLNLFSGEAGLTALSDSEVVQASTRVSNANVTSGGTGSNPVATNGVVRPNHIADIVDRSSPAVVKIETKVKQRSSLGNSLFDDPIFERFFGDSFGGRTEQEQPGGMGSGFIFDKTGYVLTNEHVVQGADEIIVKLEGSNEEYPAKLLGSAYDLDLAVLKIEGRKDFPILKMGSSEDARVGEWVIAIGNPYGFEHTVTVGVLSAKERPISIPDSKGTRNYKHLLQTDASINPGNSGGPLLNLNGEVIGINTAVSAQAQGIGFAIPTTTINSVLEALKKNTKVVKAYMGVRLTDIEKTWVKELRLTNTDGALIMQVENNSPAEAAGLEPYDIVLSINGNKVKNTKDLQNRIQSLKPGDRARLVIVRDGSKWSASVTLGKIELGVTDN